MTSRQSSAFESSLQHRNVRRTRTHSNGRGSHSSTLCLANTSQCTNRIARLPEGTSCLFDMWSRMVYLFYRSTATVGRTSIHCKRVRIPKGALGRGIVGGCGLVTRLLVRSIATSSVTLWRCQTPEESPYTSEARKRHSSDATSRRHDSPLLPSP